MHWHCDSTWGAVTIDHDVDILETMVVAGCQGAAMIFEGSIS